MTEANNFFASFPIYQAEIRELYNLMAPTNKFDASCSEIIELLAHDKSDDVLTAVQKLRRDLRKFLATVNEMLASSLEFEQAFFLKYLQLRLSVYEELHAFAIEADELQDATRFSRELEKMNAYFMASIADLDNEAVTV